MKQDELLRTIASMASLFSEQQYKVDYSPVRNLSEQQANKSLYRYVKPSSWRRERTTRGSSEVHAEVLIGVIGFEDNNITTIQDELDCILYQFLKNNAESFIVSAGECSPPNLQPLSQSDLDSSIINGQLSISVRFLNVPTR